MTRRGVGEPADGDRLLSRLSRESGTKTSTSSTSRGQISSPKAQLVRPADARAGEAGGTVFGSRRSVRPRQLQDRGGVHCSSSRLPRTSSLITQYRRTHGGEGTRTLGGRTDVRRDAGGRERDRPSLPRRERDAGRGPDGRDPRDGHRRHGTSVLGLRIRFEQGTATPLFPGASTDSARVIFFRIRRNGQSTRSGRIVRTPLTSCGPSLRWAARGF